MKTIWSCALVATALAALPVAADVWDIQTNNANARARAGSAPR